MHYLVKMVDHVVLKVSEVEARSALIQLTPPTVNTAELELDAQMSEFLYELSLSDKHDGTYTVMYRSALITVFFLLTEIETEMSNKPKNKQKLI